MQKFTGIEYLMIDIAGNYGLDKRDWNERIQWVKDNEDNLEALLPTADAPALYHAAVQAYRDAQMGHPIGYPISLDATASGLQLLACLAGCEESAKLCNVVSTGHREDAYTNIYKAMLEKTGGTAKIQREDTKQAIMTSLYSSKAIPKKVFGEGELLKIFEQTMEERAPGAWELNQKLIGLWQPYALSHDWIMPDNFHVHIPVIDTAKIHVQVLDQPIPVDLRVNRGTKEGRSISPNLVHSIDGMVVREITRRCDYNADVIINLIENISSGKQGTSTGRHKDQMVIRLWQLYQLSGFLSVRILDYLDSDNLGLVDTSVIKSVISTLPMEPFSVMSIHDCFRVHPNNGNDLRSQYNLILSQIAASNMLSFLASQVAGHFIPVTKCNDISAQILEADYALS